MAYQAHIPNSGRLKELMTPGLEVILERATNPERKTPLTLKSVRFNNRWVCIDSTTPNALAEHIARKRMLPLFDGYSHIRREVTMGSHRFDLRLDGEGMRPMIVEVKSVTLVKAGVAMFPDAPTERGASHLRALGAMRSEDLDRMVLFIILRSDAQLFSPNVYTDPIFAQALTEVARAGVHMAAVKCAVGKRSIRMIGPLAMKL